MWNKTLSTASVFCRALVSNGYLSESQMRHAALRYRLGCSRSGGVIFWQIDQEDRIHDGKIMYYRPDCHRNKDKRFHPTWVSALLQRRYRFPDTPKASHCLFGLHLLGHTENTEITDISRPAEIKEKVTLECAKHSNISVDSVISVCHKKSVCVVEAEKTAVIMSEHYPQCIWLATGGLGEVQVEKFRPLRGHKVIMFPDTDPDGTAFKRWSEAADMVHRQIWWEDCPPIRVSRILEDRASPDQKSRKIDLVDFLFSTADYADCTD